jgi:hypothetical protein
VEIGFNANIQLGNRSSSDKPLPANNGTCNASNQAEAIKVDVNLTLSGALSARRQLDKLLQSINLPDVKWFIALLSLRKGIL